MLYVFHVDAGQMTTYDMNLTLQSVSSLKAAIERKTKIAASSLVLLVSGGEVLQSDHMVSSYSAGTDTNPIYMFSKPSEKESHLKQSMYSDLSPIVELSSGEFRSDTRSGFEGKSVAELKANVEMCCSLQPTVNTVITCATLAQQFSDLSHDVSKGCDQLVHEQHLQHQSDYKYGTSYTTSHCWYSANLNEVLESLGKIPILPALQLNAEAHRFSAFDVFEDADFEGQYYRISQPLDGSEKTNQDFGVEAFKLSEEDVFGHKDASTSKDASQPAPTPAPAATEPIEDSDEGIDAEPLKELEEELCNVLEYANVHGLKQIKGIEDRLYRLDQLLSEVKKLERDQHDQAASLIQYRERLNAACDPSILTTLVQSHWCQLEKLLKGHQTLVDIRRRIAKSKDELSHILKARLKYV
ncbi:hypothetical protein MSG28_002122 [Choristoneura fumiferana]|uniref:Uncharacterized protein n=1 Tax=Choristoneura fumiferana TaxID=7141 RepID=A0ACC0JUD8_CHOFU|nr:hypothetical protein MSG28_002122 [Choristoneura fumiferana]